MTEALRQLLVEEEAREAAARDAARQARFEALMAMSRLTEFSDEAIVGYDANGLLGAVAIVAGEPGAAALNAVLAKASDPAVPSPCLLEGLALLDGLLAETGTRVAPFTEGPAGDRRSRRSCATARGAIRRG